MDRYNLRIAVTENDEIINLINNADKIDRLTVDCRKIDINNEDSYKKADVLIIDANAPYALIHQVYDNRAPYAVVVLACEISQFKILGDDSKSNLFDIWINAEPELYSYRVNQFLFRMRDYLDAELAANQLDTLIDSVPDLIWFKDPIGSHIKVNNSFCDTVNKTKEQIKYRGHCYIWDLDMSEYEQGEYVCMETEEVVIKEQGTFLFDEKVKISDEMRQLKTYKSAIVGRNGETIGTVGLARDVTDIWNTHAEFKTLINHLPFPMMIVTDDFKFVSGNIIFDDIFGENSHGENFDLEKFGNQFFNQDISMKDKIDKTMECQMACKDKTCTFLIEKSPIYDVFNQLNGFFFIFNDITTQREYERKLKSISRTDELTDINNRVAIRNYFDTNFQKAYSNRIPVSVMMMDIDYFKNYNDKYGHPSGDKVLAAIGYILKEISAETGIFVARYGGEEFILIAENKTQSEIKNFADDLCSRIKERKIPHESSEVSDIVTASLGVAYFKNISLNNTVGDIIKIADSLLYEAKNSGRNRWIFKEIN